MGVLTGKHILVVEDDSLNRLVYRLSLTKQGAKVDFDANGRAAIHRLEQLQSIDLIILDLMLGRGQSGFDVFDAIKAIPHLATIPIVAVSATDPHNGITTTRAKGFNGFIAKPIDAEHFAEQLVQILNGESVWHMGHFVAVQPQSIGIHNT